MLISLPLKTSSRNNADLFKPCRLALGEELHMAASLGKGYRTNRRGSKLVGSPPLAKNAPA